LKLEKISNKLGSELGVLTATDFIYFLQKKGKKRKENFLFGNCIV